MDRGLVFEAEVSRDVQPGVVTLLDRSRYGHNGTWVNGAYTRLPSGLWVFDGDGDDYVNLGVITEPRHGALQTDVCTINSWVILHAVPGASLTIFSSFAWYFPIVQIQTGGAVRIIAHNGDSFMIGSVIVPNAWTMITTVFDGKYKGIFLNGLLDVGAIDPTFGLTWGITGHFWGARGDATPDQMFEGYLSGLKIFKYRLSPGQILQVYESESWQFGK